MIFPQVTFKGFIAVALVFASVSTVRSTTTCRDITYKLWNADDDVVIGDLPRTIDLCKYGDIGITIEAEATASCVEQMRFKLYDAETNAVLHKHTEREHRYMMGGNLGNPFNAFHVDQLHVAGEYTLGVKPTPGVEQFVPITVKPCTSPGVPAPTPNPTPRPGSGPTGPTTDDGRLDITINGKKPNIIMFVTDQQREVREFPEGWAERNLESLQRLKDNGISYTNNYINTAPCWANRGVMMSGMFPLISQVLEVGDSLSPALAGFAKVVNRAGYRMVYKGKWHLNADFDDFSQVWNETPGAADIVREEDLLMAQYYGQEGWTSPDMGTALVSDSRGYAGKETLGAGVGQNDRRIITGEGLLSPETQESVLDFIANNKDSDEPYFLIVSLVNPHDISVYPGDLSQTGFSLDSIRTPEYDDFVLPESYAADLLDTKPDAQLNWLNGYGSRGMDPETALNYLKFYAYLTTLTDDLIGQVMDSMTPEQIEETVFIRTADHGEMGAAHGGMQEKSNTFYQEVVHTPMIISNPVLFPNALVSDEMISQIDILPTVADLVGLDSSQIKKEFNLQGKSFAATLKNPDTEIQKYILFVFYSGSNFDVEPAGDANVICAIASKRWKYAVYFAPQGGLPPDVNYTGVPSTPLGGSGTITIKISNWYPEVILERVQFEMYDLDNDPLELNNLLYGDDISDDVFAKWKELHIELTAELLTHNSMPIGWQNIII